MLQKAVARYQPWANRHPSPTGALTVDDLATKLRLTPNAVRAQITAMERDGVVRRVGRRAGTTRPSHLFELTPEVEQLLSRAYIPLLTHLVGVFARRLAGGSGRCVAAADGKKSRGRTGARKTLVGKPALPRDARERTAERAAGRRDARRSERRLCHPRRGVSPFSADRKAPGRVSRDREPGGKSCRSARSGMLRSHRTPSVLL